MPRHDNYPDDIRQYDHDPRSPFYKDPPETELYPDEAEEFFDEPDQNDISPCKG